MSWSVSTEIPCAQFPAPVRPVLLVPQKKLLGLQDGNRPDLVVRRPTAGFRVRDLLDLFQEATAEARGVHRKAHRFTEMDAPGCDEPERRSGLDHWYRLPRHLGASGHHPSYTDITTPFRRLSLQRSWHHLFQLRGHGEPLARS